MFIWMQKSIDFHLLHDEIPQLPSHYQTLQAKKEATTTKRLGWARLLLILTSCATPGRLFNFQCLEVIDKF